MRYRLKKLALHTTCIIHVMGAHIYSMDVNLYILCAETVARPALPVPPLLQIQNGSGGVSHILAEKRGVSFTLFKKHA